MDQPQAEQTFFEDEALDRAFGVVMALASEVYVLRDRLQALEALLIDNDVIAKGALDAEPDAAALAATSTDREAFVAHLLQNLLGEQVSLGAAREPNRG